MHRFFDNLLLAWRKARKGKTKRQDIIKFENNTIKNLLELQNELNSQTYQPLPLKAFPIRDPKARLIHKSDFRDRIVHHAVVNILEPIFDKTFISDSCANRTGKGTLYAIKRFDFFKRKVTKNRQIKGYCLKADIKHYFQSIDHEILLSILRRKIADENLIWLIKKIVANSSTQRERELTISPQAAKGMPLGNLTSQFFANLYVNVSP